MNICVSLPEEDVRWLDEHVRAAGLPSRSAALHEAIRLLPCAGLQRDYADAWTEWESSGDRAARENTAGDGLS